MYGYTPEEMIGSSAWDRIEEGPTREAFRAWFSHAMSEQPPLRPVFGSRVKKNGERIDIRGDCNYLRNEAGEVTGLVTVVADITDIKQAEEELAKSKAVLQAATLSLGGEERFYYNIIAPIRDREELQGILGVNIDITERTRAEVALQKAHDELERRVKERTAELAKANEQLKREVEERRRADEALRQSERRFRNYFEQGLIGMAVTSPDKRWLEVNDRLYEILGYSREELHRKTWAEVTYPDDIEPNIRLFNRLLAGEIEHFTLNKRYLKKDGSIVHTTIHTRAFRREDGTIDHIVTLVEDITARKQAEGRLAYLASFPEGNPNPVIEVGLGGDIQYVNPAAHCLFPDLREQGLSHPWLSDWNVVVRPFCEGRPETIVRSVTVADRNYQQSLHYLPQDQVVRIYSLDVTELKQVEEALRQSHDELRAVYESLGDGLLVADRKTLRIVRANASICSMLGYPEEELLSMSIASLHPKETLAAIVESLRENIVGHLPNKNNVPMVRKDGSVFYADITGDTFTYQGRPCSLGVFRDVTERREAQEALERERGTLRHLLEASDHERHLMSCEIHDGLAQELVAAIMQFDACKALKDTNPERAAEALALGMQLVREGHAEARRLIGGLRLPQLDKGGVLVAIESLVDECQKRHKAEIEFRANVAQLNLAPILENTVFRVVQECLTNACRHSKSKKVKVEITQHDDLLRIEIQDWGVGFNVDEVGDGHFGLEGVRERAKVFGGRAVIKSAPGKGTAIIVELPLSFATTASPH